MMKLVDPSTNTAQLETSTTMITNHLDYLNEVINENISSLSLPPAPSPPQMITVVPIDKDAPSSENWYHGRLDRLASEDRLRQANKLGGFLLRESERRPGSFVLSYLSFKSNAYHFKITAVFGDYYIGGRQFDRLETLISYYMFYSELVKGEKLLNPIPPPVISKLERTYLSIKPHPAHTRSIQFSNRLQMASNDWINNEDILYFNNVGERFRVFHEVDDGEWLWAENAAGDSGLLAADCSVCVEDEKLHEIEPWYYANISKEDVRIILASVGNFSYLVRPSEQAPGNYTLFFNADVVHRYRITEVHTDTEVISKSSTFNKYFQIGGRNFTTISSIIDRYMNEDIADGYRLTSIPHKRPEFYSQSIVTFLLVYCQESADANERKLYNNSKKSSFKNPKNPSLKKSTETDTTDYAANRKKSFNEDLFQSASSKLAKHPSQNSLVSSQSSKLVSSKSISSPLSGYTAPTNQDNLSKSLKKKFGNQASLERTSVESDSEQSMSDKVNLRGYLNKYNEKTKKWKSYLFSLNQSDQQMFYFSKEKKAKEKGMIDLSYGFYYPVDDSFFNKSFCFQIIIHSFGTTSTGQTANITQNHNYNNIITYYLFTDDAKSFSTWTEHIRPLCNPVQFNPFVSQNISGNSSMSCLSLSSSLSSSTSSTCSSTSPVATNTNSSHSSNSSSPMPQSLEVANGSKVKTNSQTPGVDDKNYRILRTLSVTIHEARNVCFYPLPQIGGKSDIQGTSTFNETGGGSSSNMPMMPKYHKENMYRCLVLFNNEAFVASTRPRMCNNLMPNLVNSGDQNQASNKYTSKNSIWDDSFCFDNLPLDVHELKLCLFCIAKPNTFSASFVNNLKKISSSITTSKMLEPLLIGTVNIRLDNLINKGLQENWYNVEPMVNIEHTPANLTQSGDLTSKTFNNNCNMRVKLRFCEEKIQLNKDYYKELCDYLMDENEHKHLCTIYEQIVPSTERSHLVQALLRFYIVKNRIVEMLKSFLLTEIDRSSDLSTLFRPASMSTSLMDQYMSTRCGDFLRKALEEPLIRILKQNNVPDRNHAANNVSSNSQAFSNVRSFELDPTKCPEPLQREQNLLNFQAALNELISSICNKTSVHLFPNELKYLFHLVREHVHSKLQLRNANATTEEKLVRIYCVSAFVFLRLLVPAMLNPKNFDLKFFENIYNPPAPVIDPQQVPKNLLDYADLAVQFSVFSPNFMISLSSTNNNSIQAQSKNSQNITVTPVSNSSTGNSSSLNSNSSSQISDQMATTFERHIKLLAKVLQTLANNTECKEPFMMPLSEFLNLNKPSVIEFIDDVSNLKELSEAQVIRINDFYEETGDSNLGERKDVEGREEVHAQFEYASCKYLAILNRLLNTFVPEMRAYLQKVVVGGEGKKLESDAGLDDGTEEMTKENDKGFHMSLERLVNILYRINGKNSK